MGHPVYNLCCIDLFPGYQSTHLPVILVGFTFLITAAELSRPARSAMDELTDFAPVLVIGASSLDVKGRAEEALEKGSSNHGLVRSSMGGVARNIAENLARLGVSTVLLSAVGADGTGKRLLAHAADSGIDTRHVLIDPEGRTGSYLAIFDQHGGGFVSIDDMAILNRITPRYVNDRRRLFRDARMIVVDANLPPRTLKTVFRLAQQYRVPVCADPTRKNLAPRLRPYLKQLFMVTPNPAEVEALLGRGPINGRSDAIAAAKQLVARGVEIAVVTLAEMGVCYATSNESGHVPALDIDIVDLTGAGDALSAAVIFGLLEDMPVGEAIRLGVSAAALTLQTRETVCRDLSLEKLYDQVVV
jgi:pseudouridine kinase